MKVWARGSGKADFTLNNEYGVSKLNMSFSLGHPSELHCLPRERGPVGPQHHGDQDWDKGRHPYSGVRGDVAAKKHHKKSAARHERDRLRARPFQAKKKSAKT